MDYRIIDLMIKKYNEKKIDYLSNIHPPTLPDGFDIEIFTFEALKKTYLSANQDFQKEHVTPFIWDNPKKFLIKNFVYKKIKNLYNKYRLTLDYKEDYYVISKIYNALYFKNKFFSLEDILKYINKNPSIMINKKFIKVNWYKDHLKKLKTIKKKDTKNIKN
jgi:spore coat polysaccharide biosynthesis protein SpsF